MSQMAAQNDGSERSVSKILHKNNGTARAEEDEEVKYGAVSISAAQKTKRERTGNN